MKVTMPYFGYLSVNSYKAVSKGGKATLGTKLEVQIWMVQLAKKVRSLKEITNEDLSGYITVAIWGKFRDSRIPDLANLHKVIGDAVSNGLGINDKFFRFSDLGFSTGVLSPELDIYISKSLGGF